MREVEEEEDEEEEEEEKEEEEEEGTLGARYIVAANKKNPSLWNDNDQAQFFFF